MRPVHLALSLSLMSLQTARGEESPLCTELARTSCAAGTYKDATGEVLSQNDLNTLMTSYADKARRKLAAKFNAVLEDPDQGYFKDQSLAAFGLKNSVECTSTDAEDQRTCRTHLVESLTDHAMRLTSDLLGPKGAPSAAVNLAEVMQVSANQTFVEIIKDFNGDAQKDLARPQLTAKIKDKIFPEIKSLLIERINKANIPDQQKQFMVNKIKGIRFGGTSCTPPNNYGPAPDQNVSKLIEPNAFYEPGSNTFNYCTGLMIMTSSEFTAAFTIAHELSHSVDPCFLAAGPADSGFKYKPDPNRAKLERQYPFGNVLGCLRTPKSLGARSVSNAVPIAGVPMPPTGPVTPESGGQYPMYPVADQSSQVPPFCTQDQVEEGFADWLGAEVTPQYFAKNYQFSAKEYQQGYANALRSICRMTGNAPIPGDEHSATGDRINKILLVQPLIRAQMGCSPAHPEYLYCDADHEIAEPTSSPKMNKNMLQMMQQMMQPQGDAGVAQ